MPLVGPRHTYSLKPVSQRGRHQCRPIAPKPRQAEVELSKGSTVAEEFGDTLSGHIKTVGKLHE